MLVVTRFRFPDPAATVAAIRERLDAVVEVFAGRPGFFDADLGRNLDDPALWVLVSRWADVGSYRRALSGYDVKMALGMVQAAILDEPSAYESGAGEFNENVPR